MRRSGILCCVALLLTAAGVVPREIQEEYRIPADGRGPALVLDVQDTIYAPEEDALLAQPVDLVFHEDRLYVLDHQDRNVKVLSARGEHLSTFGRPGAGPGEFENPTRISIDDADRIFVYEQVSNELEAFDLDGKHLFSTRVRWLSYPPMSFQAVDDGLLVFGGASLSPELYGFGVHVFQVRALPNDRPEIVHVRSFAPTPDLDPGIYEEVAGGNAIIDDDGNVVYAQQNPHMVAKYTLTGRRLWVYSDEDLMVPFRDKLTTTASGAVRLDFFPRSLTLHDDGELYIHQIISPPARKETPGQPAPLEVITELIPANGDPSGVRRFRADNSVILEARKAEGRFFGLRDPFSSEIILVELNQGS